MGAVVSVVAVANGVEVPVLVVFGPEVDFDLVAFTGGGELNRAILSLVESEVGEEGIFREFFPHDEDVFVKAMKP